MFHYTFLHLFTPFYTFLHFFNTFNFCYGGAAENTTFAIGRREQKWYFSPARQNSTLCTKHAKCIILVFCGLTFRISQNSFCGLRSKIRYCAPKEEKTWAGNISSTLPHELKAKVANTRYELANFTAVEPILFFTTPGPKMPHSRS